MRIEVRGIPGNAGLRAYVVRTLTPALEPLRVKPVTVQVTFADENGPKGGVAIRCRLAVRLPRRPAVQVEHLGETQRLAFDGGFAKLGRQLGRDRGRERERRRRPKKYFTAKRLLEGPPEGERAAG